MKNILNNKFAVIGLIVILSGASFYCGMKYSTSKTVSVVGRGGMMGNFANMPPAERATRGAQAGGTRSGMRGAGGSFVSGEILSRDATGVTVKSADGGSKIVFFSASTTVMKSALGAPEDVSAGQQVVITGKTNTDGSLTAESIQIRPTQPK